MGNVNTKHLVPKDLMNFQQNIRNLNNKSDEILNFMDRVPTLKSINSKLGGKLGVINGHTISILHQNICSLRHKITELELWLNTELNHVNVIC